MKAIIHVNRHLIAKNRKDGGHRPVYAVKHGRKTIYAHGVSITGSVRFVDPRSDKPLSCGATIYAVAEGDVSCVDPIPYQDIEEN